MTRLLIRLFVKNSGDTENPAVRKSYGTLSGGVGIFRIGDCKEPIIKTSPREDL